MSRKTSRCGGGVRLRRAPVIDVYTPKCGLTAYKILLIDIWGSQSNFIDFDPVLRSEIWKGGGGWQSVCRHCTVYSK